MITITQGDTAILNLTAQNKAGQKHDLTGATFETKIKGASGDNTFADVKHAIVSAVDGTYTLTLSATDTAAILAGQSRELVTKVTQGTSVKHFHGRVLTVLKNTPES